MFPTLAAAVVIGLYVGLLLLIGVRARRAQRSKQQGDFFLAGRGLGLVVLLMTLYATQYSGNTFVGYAAEGYRSGGAFLYGALILGVVPAAYLLFGPRLRRLATRHNFVTLGDYIQHRYRSRTLRLLISLATTVALVNFMVTNLIALGIITERLSDGAISYELSVVAMAAVMLIYELLGGLRGVAWSDVLQGTLILGGSLTFLALVVALLGGFTPAIESVRASAPGLLEPPGLDGNITWLSSVALFAIGASLYPHALQRIYAAKSDRTLKRALAMMVFLPFITALPAITWGVLGNSLFGGLGAEASEQITPLLLERVVQQFPLITWVALIFVAAVLAAIMSTIDSALLSSASAVVNDFVPVRPRARIAIAKAASVALMAGAVALALAFQGNIFALIELKFELLLPCAPSVYLGLYWKRLTAAPLIAGFAAGLGLTLALLVASTATDAVPARPLGVHAGLWGLLLNLTVVAAAMAIRARRARLAV